MVDPADLAKMRAPGRARPRQGRVRDEGPAKLAARMIAGDEAGAWGVIEATLASGVEPSDIYLDFLVPALRAIGDRWAAGELTVADEHRAAAVASGWSGGWAPGSPAGAASGAPSSSVRRQVTNTAFRAPSSATSCGVRGSRCSTLARTRRCNPLSIPRRRPTAWSPS